jgi:hypothetical protein
MDTRWLVAAFRLTTLLLKNPFEQLGRQRVLLLLVRALVGLCLRLDYLLLQTDLSIKHIGHLAIVGQFSYSYGLALPAR